MRRITQQVPGDDGATLLRFTRGTHADARGQSLVEFVLVASVLIMILAGIIDLGRAYFSLLQLRDAAAEGAYFGQANPTKWCASAVAPCTGAYAAYTSADPNNIVYRIRNSAPAGGLIDWSNATITITPPATIEPGRFLTVTVSYQYTLITPVIGAIAGTQTLTLSASEVSTIVTPP